MPVEIKELHIKVVVRDTGSAAATPGRVDVIDEALLWTIAARGTDPVPCDLAPDRVTSGPDADPHSSWGGPDHPWATDDVW